MLLVLCVDLDDDLGRKTDVETPVVGRDNVVDAAVALASADPEDSDVNVLFEGVHIADEIDDEPVEVAAVTGVDAGDVAANRAVGEEVDTVLASLAASEDVRALVVTDGAQDESVVPVIRSRIRIDGVRRVVVRQAQDLESMYYTIKQVLDDPETRGTILVPLGILLLIYPGVGGVNALEARPRPLSAVEALAALVNGAVQWFAAAGITSSLGRVTDEYLNGAFEWRYLNAPFYVLAIGGVLNGLSAFFLGERSLEYLAVVLTAGTLLGLASTLAFAIAESRLTGTERHNQGPGGPSSE